MRQDLRRGRWRWVRWGRVMEGNRDNCNWTTIKKEETLFEVCWGVIDFASQSKAGARQGRVCEGVFPIGLCIPCFKEIPWLWVSVSLLWDGSHKSYLTRLLSGSNERTHTKLTWYKKGTPETWGRDRVLGQSFGGYVDQCHIRGGHSQTL